MFTGIVEAIGKVVKYDGTHLGIRASFRSIRLGESISVSGVCLTVTRQANGVLSFDVGPQTRRVTTLGKLKPSSTVNLERSLRVGDRVGGHWVTGHVGVTGRIEKLEAAGHSRWITVAIPKAASRYVVDRGSIAIDGVSLTVAEIRNDRVKIMLIPHTLKHTTLGQKKPGDAVNVEPDLLAKYAERLDVKIR